MGSKLIRIPGQPFNAIDLHGRWCTFTMVGQDVGYARVYVEDSSDEYMLIKNGKRRGLIAKQYIKYVTEVDKIPRKLKESQSESEASVKLIKDPFSLFLDSRLDIHMHQTRMFEASPGFFEAKILYAGEKILRIRENSKEYNIRRDAICAVMEK